MQNSEIGGPKYSSKEVVWGTSADHGFSGARARIKLEAIGVSARSGGPVLTFSEKRYSQGVLEMFIYFHNRSLVATAVAIVWS